jgi:predicted nucleic acid-binding protein
MIAISPTDEADCFADTGPLYAAVDPDDQYHGRAQRELKRLSRDRRAVVVAYPILLESYTLVLYRLGEQAALTWLTETMDGASFINPTADDYRAAAGKVLSFPWSRGRFLGQFA